MSTSEWEVVLKKAKTAPQKTLRKGESKKLLKDYEQTQKKLQDKFFGKSAGVTNPTPAGTAFSESRKRSPKSSSPKDFSNKSPKVVPPPLVAKKTKKKTLKAAGDSINKDLLHSAMCDWEEKYRDGFSTQLQKLAEYFEKAFATSTLGPLREQGQKSFHRRIQIPAAYINRDIFKLVHKFIFGRAISTDILANYFWFLLTTLLAVENKSNEHFHELSGLGLRILLQIMVRDGSLDLLQIHKRQIETELYKKNKLPTTTLNLFIWLSGQYLFSTPTRSFLHWLTYCLPALNSSSSIRLGSKRSVAQAYALDHLHALVDDKLNFQSPTQSEAAALAHGAERLLLALVSESTTPALIPIIPPAIALLLELAESSVFSVLLGHAASTRPQLRLKAIELLVDALGTKPSRTQIWLRIHADHIAQSNNLILYLREHWNQVRSKVDPSTLQPSLLKILQINKSLLVGKYIPPDSTVPRKIGPEDLVDINMCTLTGKALLQKMNERSWIRVGLVIAVPLALFTGAATLYTCCVDSPPGFCAQFEAVCQLSLPQ